MFWIICSCVWIILPTSTSVILTAQYYFNLSVVTATLVLDFYNSVSQVNIYFTTPNARLGLK